MHIDTHKGSYRGQGGAYINPAEAIMIIYYVIFLSSFTSGKNKGPYFDVLVLWLLPPVSGDVFGRSLCHTEA